MQEKKKEKSIAAIPKNPYVELILQIYVKPSIIFFKNIILKILIGYLKKMEN
jgi:hypothetical protein